MGKVGNRNSILLAGKKHTCHEGGLLSLAWHCDRETECEADVMLGLGLLLGTEAPVMMPKGIDFPGFLFPAFRHEAHKVTKGVCYHLHDNLMGNRV